MTREYRIALEHWAKQFRNGTLSDEFADEIAYLLEDKAHDLKMDEPKTFNRKYVVNVDVRFHVGASNDEEAWKICKEKAELLYKLLNDVADDFAAADVWEITETDQ